MRKGEETEATSHTIHTKVNSKWVTDLNVNNKTIQVLKENTGASPYKYGIQSSNHYSQVATEHLKWG